MDGISNVSNPKKDEVHGVVEVDDIEVERSGKDIAVLSWEKNTLNE
jgi:hypothetical protein